MNCREIEKNIISYGLRLPSVNENNYFSAGRTFGEKMIYISGCGPNGVTDITYKGQVGVDYSVEEAKIAARLCAVNCLAVLKHTIGLEKKIKQIVKLSVYVSSPTGFSEQAQVAHGASEFLNQILGEKVGKATRSAIGVVGLPLNFPVEVEMLVELEQ